MSKELEVSSVPRLLVPLLLLIAAAGVVDLWFDSPEIWWSPHVMTDVFLVVLSFATALYLWMGWRHTDRALARMMEALDERQEERDLWRKRTEDLLSGLGEATEELFMGWTLTPTERETALLLLKGHSHKRIAQMTDRSERTVRQHAVAVYRKSGLGGRAALSAFFLEHLMLPEAIEESA